MINIFTIKSYKTCQNKKKIAYTKMKIGKDMKS